MSDGPKSDIIKALKAHGVNPDERGSLVERLLNIIVGELIRGNSGTEGVSLRVDPSPQDPNVNVFTVLDTRKAEPRHWVFYSSHGGWIEGLPRPQTPGAYWNPEVSTVDIYTLRKTGEWLHNINGKLVHPSNVPDDLVMLGAL